jgi:hypothetical protein
MERKKMSNQPPQMQDFDSLEKALQRKVKFFLDLAEEKEGRR